MKINKRSIGLGIFNMFIGLQLIIATHIYFLTSLNLPIQGWFAGFLIGLIIIIFGIFMFLSGIKLEKNEVF